MNKLFSMHRVVAALAVMAVFSVQSCVNEEYDLSQGVDMEIQVLQNASLPLGDVAKIQINTLLGDTDSGSSIFNIDDNGDLSISFGNDVLSQSFKMPEVNIAGDGGLSAQNKRVDFKMKPKYSGISGYELKRLLQIYDGVDLIYYTEHGDVLKPSGNGLSLHLTTDMDKELPEQVLSVRTLNMDADLNFKFIVSDGAIMNLEEGFTLVFPEYMVLAEAPVDAPYVIIDNNTLIFTKDVNISYEFPLVLDLKLLQMVGVDEMIEEKTGIDGEPRRFICNNGHIDVRGDIYMDPDDYGYFTVPENPFMMMKVELDNLSMTSAELMIDMDLKIEDKKIQIGDMPDMFTGKGTVVDLYNPILRFKLDNNSPLELDFNAELSSYTNGRTTDIHIGSYCKNGNQETAPVVLPANKEVEYYFSRRGEHYTENGNDIALEKIGDIITELPDNLIIHDITVVSDREYITVYAEQEFTVNLEYEFFSPMAFGKDLNISFSYDINLALEDQSLGLDSLLVTMNMVNSIPLEFDIKGVALDQYGREIKDASVDLDLHLDAGTHDNPVESPVEIVLNASNVMTSISTLRLMLTATENDQMQGCTLNTAQGLSLNDLHITLPKGIVLDLNSSEPDYNYNEE